MICGCSVANKAATWAFSLVQALVKKLSYTCTFWWVVPIVDAETQCPFPVFKIWLKSPWSDHSSLTQGHGTGITFFSRFWAASMVESVSQGVRLSRMSLSQIRRSSSGINIPASSFLLWYPLTKKGSSLLTCFIGFLCRFFNIRTLITARLNGGIGRNS